MDKFKKAWDRKEYISYGSIKKLGPWANLDESVNEANSYDSWKERGNQLEKQAKADAINAFGKAAKRKDFEEMVDMFVSDREINGGEYLDAFRIVLKKYNLVDEFRKQLADLDITKTPYEMNEFGPGYSPQGMFNDIPALVNRIGDLDDILMNDRKAEREWEEISQRYLDGEEGSTYWGDLGDQELQDAIDDAESLMKKYRIKESVKENVSSPYIYQIGDLVQNVNPTCPHHGSKGIVMSVEPEELTYSVTNSGDTFKPGMRLTKTLDQLAAL